MKYEKCFSIGIRSKLLESIKKESDITQKSKGKVIRDTLNKADFSKIGFRDLTKKIHYDWSDKKRAISVRFEEKFIENLDFIALVKNKSRDQLINEALENELLK